MLDAGAEGFGAGFFGGEAGGETLCGRGAGAAVGDFRVGKDAAEEPVAEALDGAQDARHFDEVDAGAHDHDATLAQGKSFSVLRGQIALMRWPRFSDAESVNEIAEPGREQKRWELELGAQCADDPARTVRFLTGAVMACGGYVLSRRFDANKTATIEFEFVRATCVEMYSVLIAAGLELTGASHLLLATLCQCTRETLEATAGDAVRVELTIRKGTGLACDKEGGSVPPPRVA